jgi:CheY-like chemotaxis protein
MSRILLADDSPHAQRMGERILREEGFEVVTVTDGQTAMMRLADVDPDVVLADVSLPRTSGYDICRHIKDARRYSHVRVILTAGLLERFDEQRAEEVRPDGVLKKPFESSALVALVRPLTEAAQADRAVKLDEPEPATPEAVPVRVVDQPGPAPIAQSVDPERVRAAVVLALDAALPSMIDNITERVLIALGH